MAVAPFKLKLPSLHGLRVSSSSFRRRSIQCASTNQRRALFNSIAPVYDNLNDLLSLGQHRIWKRMAAVLGVGMQFLLHLNGSSNFGEIPNRAKMRDHVLDVSCGSGDLAFLLSEKVGSNSKEWMIDNVVVPLASGYGLSEEYTYLRSSIREFLTGKELEKLALEVGFSTARHYEISGGLMGCLEAIH